jgi:hypothetical protein
MNTDTTSIPSWGKNAKAPSRIIRPKISRRIPRPMYSPLLFILLSLLFRILLLYAAKMIRRITMASEKPIVADLGFAPGDVSVRTNGIVSRIKKMESSINPVAMNRILSFLFISFMGQILWNY